MTARQRTPGRGLQRGLTRQSRIKAAPAACHSDKPRFRAEPATIR